MCVVEDEKVSIDELCEQIQEFEDYVQSVDIAAMSKIWLQDGLFMRVNDYFE